MDVRSIATLPSGFEAVVDVPGSKSIANRALVCAALADGTSELTNVPDGDDTVAMVGCLRALGVETVLDDGRVVVAGGRALTEPVALHAGLAGTTSRFVTALAALGSAPITVDGLPPLRRRPFGPLHDALVQLGVRVDASAGWGSLPVTVQGPPTGGVVHIPGDVSSQYVTALMLIGPYLPDGLVLELTSVLVSRPYVDMTAAVMASFGHDGVTVADDRVVVEPGRYRPADLFVEPDASSASYPLAMAAVAGGAVTVRGLGSRAVQGDARFADLLADMGCPVERTNDSVRVSAPPDGALAGIDVDMADVSDLVPTVAAVALFATTPTTIRGVGFIRGKESDRLGDLARELRSVGGDVDEQTRRPRGASVGAPPARRPARHAPRPSTGDGVRRRRRTRPRPRRRGPGCGVEELAGLLGDAGRLAMTSPEHERPVVAAFDFDETITRGDSVVPFLRRVAGTPRVALGVLARIHRVLPAAVRRDRDRLRAIATEAVFTGLDPEHVRRHADEHARTLITGGLKPDVVDRIRWHLDQGHRVVIVSASYEHYVEVVASHLGLHGVAATRLELGTDGRFTGRLHGPNCRAAEKVVRLDAWLAEHGLARATVTLWAYGDSAGDRELLAVADHPVWVSGPLASVAPTS
jgi:3-phosphoshikimate 1-carboxyvinyltransferase